MTEHDIFEVRLAAAVHAYAGRVSSELDPVELAHRIAASEPRRDGLASALPWRMAAIPRRAWVLLLLAALLTALVAGTLIVGSRPVQELPAVVPPAPAVIPPVGPPVGPAFVCPPGSTPDTPGPIDQVRPSGFSGMAFDRRAGRLVTLSDTETWTFDVCTNTWLRMHPTQKPPTSPVGPLVYDVDSDMTIGVFGPDEHPGNMWVYDLRANTWREVGPFAPFAYPRFASLRFYDLISGRVVARGDDGDDDTLGLALWGYEVETDTWTLVNQAEPLDIGPHYEFFAYDAVVDRLVAYAKTWEAAGGGDWRFAAKTWLFDLRTGTWSETRAVTPPEFSAGMWGLVPGIAYDEAAEQTVMMGQGYSAAYEATADRWEMLYETPSDEPGACGTRPECRQAPDMLYDSVNERLIVYGGSVYTSAETGWVDPDDLLAFDTRTHEWTVLLEPGKAQPGPVSE
jgi:hypothetical protein